MKQNAYWRGVPVASTGEDSFLVAKAYASDKSYNKTNLHTELVRNAAARVAWPNQYARSHAGSGLPFVSSPNGNSRSPTTNASDVSATGVPIV